MTVLKVVTTVLLMALPAVLLYRDWRHHDRRTKSYRHISRWCLVGCVAAGLLSSFLVWYEAYQASILSSRIDELVRGKDQIVQQNEELLSQNAQFQEDLLAEKEKTRQLQLEINKSKRGITTHYDFQGNKRTTVGGRISIDTSLRSAFREMASLQDQHRWQDLLKLCERNIQSDPEWLTPYMLAAAAHAHLGRVTRRSTYRASRARSSC